MTRKAIGSIKCPLCDRAAELHEFEERKKLNPDGPAPKASYPKKCFIVCPPTTGYRGCGTILANSALAQERLTELADVHGAPRKESTASPAPAKAAVSPAAATPAPASAAKPAKKSISFFDW